MTPKKTTLDAERNAERLAKCQQVCDVIVERAATMMVEEAGASVVLVIDRLMTYALAQACTTDGSPRTAEALRKFADNVERGLFHSITGEGKSVGRRH